MLTVYKRRGDKFSVIFFIPYAGKSKEGESFYSGIVVGRYKQFICISQLAIRISITIKCPCFIEREWQLVVYITVHEFEIRKLDQII